MCIDKKLDNPDCECKTCKGIHSVCNGPGNMEAVVQCQDCDQLYYSIFYEQMSFVGEDVQEEYQIPIFIEEYLELQRRGGTQPDLTFLKDRKARSIFQGGKISEIDAVTAMKRCGRL